MSDKLDKALDNLQAQIDKEAERKRQAEEAERVAEEAKRKFEMEKRKMRERFPEAVKENQIEEVKGLIEAQADRKYSYRYDVHPVPSVEMAEVLVGDMRSILSNDEYDGYNSISERMVEFAISAHPEDAKKWDKFAKDHNISYNFRTTNREVFDKVIEQGFDVQCFNFESLAENYFDAKNGYVGYRTISRDIDEDIWVDQNPVRAAQIKEDLIHVLSCGYQINLSEKDNKSYLFMQELLKERELEKNGVTKSFTYRDPSEKFYDTATGECNLSSYHLSLVIGNHVDFGHNGEAKGTINQQRFTGQIEYSDGSKFQYKDNELKGVAKINKCSWKPEYKYYENGVDVTQKHEALKRIASKRINKEKTKQEKTGKPVIFKKMGTIQKAIELMKAKEELKNSTNR